MPIDRVKLQAQQETDDDILAFIRDMQKHAPVVEDSVHNFLANARRRRITRTETKDRLDYLVSAGLLRAETVWNAGEEVHYTITALGMDVKDGVAPPRNWRPGSGT